jgi:hypothetical protein
VAGTLYVAVPVPLTLGAAQVLPGWIVKAEPAGNWSLVPNGVVAPTVPPGWPAVSFTASITGVACVATLLPAALSLVAPVVAVKVTLVVGSSAPPAVPGAV